VVVNLDGDGDGDGYGDVLDLTQVWVPPGTWRFT
jgi:hypothetical protein